VFRPRPRVDSALVAFRRLPRVEDYARVKEVVDAAFRHRRKTLANSVEQAGLATRAEAAAALERLGFAPNVRAESLPPPAFPRLAELLG
jgi:16S rRNA (adenine1518-N6/adenine1519-N6)-dimethyltransferase